MALIKIEKEELKALIKESIREVLHEDELEDFYFGKMVAEGDTGQYVTRNEIDKALDTIQ